LRERLACFLQDALGLRDGLKPTDNHIDMERVEFEAPTAPASIRRRGRAALSTPIFAPIFAVPAVAAPVRSINCHSHGRFWFL